MNEEETAEKQLSELELAYQKALLTLPADYSKENQAIADARAELNAAIAKRDSYSPDQGSDNSSQDTYNANKSQLNYYTKLQTKLQNTISAIDMDEYASAGLAGDYPVLTVWLECTSFRLRKTIFVQNSA